STKELKSSYIFSLMAKSDMQGACVIFRLCRSYIIFALTSLEERNNTLLKAKYNCLSNITCRKANITNGAAINPYRYSV
ncbi:MAG: hypothetical protein ACI4SC_01555, partial [Candidatus Neoclostridium sp.]